jgi:hypothetical protein
MPYKPFQIAPNMISWLTKNNINFNNKAKKPEIYGIVKLNKGPPIYKVDEFLKRKGHEVLRLPPYHCELNPIELIFFQFPLVWHLISKTFVQYIFLHVHVHVAT